MRKTKVDNIILIPSLEPDMELISYVQKLKAYGLTNIIIVDDGSSEKYQSIFKTLHNEGCIILRHAENRGKGCALKTGLQYIKNNYGHFSCVVTADSDGQHASEDVDRLAEYSSLHPNALILGVRDFTSAGIPLKSLLGNRFSSVVFAALYGKYLPDTQTGLRAFGPSALEFMLGIPGSRFEYEIQALISCVQFGIPILTLPIQCLYFNENKGTHFKPFRDSIQIIRILLSYFIRFSFSSMMSAVIDLGIAWFLLDVFRSAMQQQEFLRIFLATAIARVISTAMNYLLNKYFVFQRKKTGTGSLSRYLFLCVLIIFLSSSGVFFLTNLFRINDKVGKVICDSVLFILSYRVQQRWVFAKGGKNHDTE